MSSHVIRAQADQFMKSVPEILPGYTVRVHEKIQEGDKARVQIFEGLVISVHKGHVPTDRSFTVRKVVSGIGVEKVFATHSPTLEKIEVKKVAKTRRAKLFFVRGRTGKAARMIERLTTEGEFSTKPADDLTEAVAPAEEVKAAMEEQAAAPIIEEAPKVEETKKEEQPSA